MGVTKISNSESDDGVVCHPTVNTRYGLPKSKNLVTSFSYSRNDRKISIIWVTGAVIYGSTVTQTVSKIINFWFT